MKKGFLHVVEALIVIMLIFVVLSQFYSIPRPQHQWSSTKLTLMAQDLLYTMDEIGVDWFNSADVNATLYDALPRTMGYALSTEQTIRPKMKVGCVCNVNNFLTLEGLLVDFPLNGVDRDFTLERIPPGSMDFSLDVITQYDTIVFWGFPDINIQEATNLSEYLRQGNGVVLFSNLTETQVGESWHRNVFNLEWVSSTARPKFSTADFHYFEPTDEGYAVKKIFDHFTQVFTHFNDFGDESVYPKDGSESRIIAELGDTYTGTVKHVPLAVINWAVNGNGRSAWMSNATLSDTDNANLLKSLILWAVGGKAFNVIEDDMAESAKASMWKVYNSNMFEPVKIELTLGYHF